MAHQIQEYVAELFYPHAGRQFTFLRPADPSGSRSSVVFDLVKVDAHEEFGRRVGVGPDRLYKRVPFSLLFRLCSQAPLGRGLHQIQHPDFEPEEWFLSRIMLPGQDPGPSCMWYEAVFA